MSPEKKIGGVLVPLFALRSDDDLGVGDTASLVELAEWAASAELKAVQILPVNETGGDHSPYNVISAFALEPSTIATHPAHLPDLDEESFRKIRAKHPLSEGSESAVDYPSVKRLKWALLEHAWKNFRAAKGNKARSRAFAQWRKLHADWLEPYAIFRSLMRLNDDVEVVHFWPTRHQSPLAVEKWRKSSAAAAGKLDELVEFFSYVQWIAHSQWHAAGERCRKLGISLIGDVPVGVSIHSADVFFQPEIFDIERSSGAPPEKVFKTDAFTEKWGQNWGFPLYRWDAMRRDSFRWWRQRLALQRQLFELIRLDHALGFFRIYSFPWRPDQNGQFLPLDRDQAMEKTNRRLPCFMPRDDSSLENQLLNRSQGEELLEMMIEVVGEHRIIAEDLGLVPEYVRPTLTALGVAGFKIPQWERRSDREMIPGTEYDRISLATFATHDHEPLKLFWDRWHREAESEDWGVAENAKRCMRELLDFAGRPDLPVPLPFAEAHPVLIRGLYLCNSWLAIHMVTDLLGLDDRFNAPGEQDGSNWRNRIPTPISLWSRKWHDEIEASRLALRETGRS